MNRENWPSNCVYSGCVDGYDTDEERQWKIEENRRKS